MNLESDVEVPGNRSAWLLARLKQDAFQRTVQPGSQPDQEERYILSKH